MYWLVDTLPQYRCQRIEIVNCRAQRKRDGVVGKIFQNWLEECNTGDKKPLEEVTHCMMRSRNGDVV